MRKLRDVAEVAARSAVLALEAAWLAVLVAGTVALLGSDASPALRLAAAFGLTALACSAALVAALLGASRRD